MLGFEEEEDDERGKEEEEEDIFGLFKDKKFDWSDLKDKKIFDLGESTDDLDEMNIHMRMLEELFNIEKLYEIKIPNKTENMELWMELCDKIPIRLRKYEPLFRVKISKPEKIKEIISVFKSPEEFVNSLIDLSYSKSVNLFESYNNDEVSIFELYERAKSRKKELNEDFNF